jgi:hypothetical protein
MPPDPARAEDTRAWLDKAAWRFRYPGDASEPTREEATAALAIAQDVFQAVIDRLPAEIRQAGQA